MATTIKLKNGSGAPLAGDLVQGEPALDLTNKRLYTEDSGGTVIEVGTNPSTIDINAGTIDGTVIGGASAAAGTFTTFTSTGIDDNATSTAITIDASENVGIGETNPQYNIHVKSSSDTGIQLTKDGVIAGRISAVTTGMSFGVDGANGTTERMRIDSSGNVGIGTATPSAKLSIKTTSPGNLINTDDGTVITYIADTTGNQLKYGTFNSYPVVFHTNNAERMRIDSSGNVDLSANVGSTLTFQRTGSADGNGVIKSTGNGGVENARITLGGGSNNALIFGTGSSGTERMRIDSSGNLLVGTTSSPNGGSSGVQVYNNTNRGRVDIGKTVTGTANAITNYHNGSYVGGVNYSDTATSFPTSSDVRLKENIVDAPAGNIDDIRVRSFDWKVDGSHQTYGVIAQELVDVAPEAVSKGETEDDVWGVDYSKLVPMMIKEIQDLKAEVAALKGA